MGKKKRRGSPITHLTEHQVPMRPAEGGFPACCNPQGNKCPIVDPSRSHDSNNAQSRYEVNLSMNPPWMVSFSGWFKGKSTRNHGFYHSIWGVPLFFSYKPIQWIIESQWSSWFSSSVSNNRRCAGLGILRAASIISCIDTKNILYAYLIYDITMMILY